MIWEAAMAASHYKLNNIIAFIDRNHLEVNGNVDELMNTEPIDLRFTSFGWNACRIDGHSVKEIKKAILWAKASVEKPTVIICETIKGKGVSFMENVMEWHSNAVTDNVYEKGMAELKAKYNQLRED